MNETATPTKVAHRHPRRLAAWLLTAMAITGLLLWLVVMLLTGANFFGSPPVEQEEAPEIDFSVKDLSGAPVSLSSLRGNVVLVNFWATWCSPCKEEMPLLQAYYDQHKADGFVLVGINVSDDAGDAQEFIDAAGYTFPVWSDPPGKVLIQLRINGLPASLVVDAEGRLVKRWVGPLAQEDLDHVITPLLKPSEKD